MAKQLPFVVRPRLQPVIAKIGSEESGIFEIERRGYLTVSEKQFVQAASAHDEAPKGLFRLVSQIAKENGTTPSKVFNDFSSIEGDNFPEYLLPYQNDFLSQSQELMIFNEKVKLIASTAILMSRHDPEWSIHDTLGLHPDIISGLSELYNDEDRRSTEELERAMENEPKQDDGNKEGKE